MLRCFWHRWRRWTLVAISTILGLCCGAILLDRPLLDVGLTARWPMVELIRPVAAAAGAAEKEGAGMVDNGDRWWSSERRDDDDNVPRLPGEARRLPQCLIIGARKCGTRALLEFLNLHPDVRTAREELHFFDRNVQYARGLTWYRRKMPFSLPHQITVEKTPAYFVSASAPERVRNMNASIRLLLIVRQPVLRAISDYTQVHVSKLAKNKTHEPFEQLVVDARSGLVRPCYKPVRNSLYYRHVRRWLQYFPRQNLHVVDGDRFVVDPLSELRAVEQFLGLPHRIESWQLYFNATKGFYCYRHPLDGAKCLGDTKGRPHVAVSPQVHQKLQSFFAPFNLKFFELINRTFSW